MLNELLKGLLGLDLDQEISRLISRYGYDAVNEAVVDQGPKPKRGRKVIEDWPEILPIISADALLWLAGQDPFRERSNYSIAKQIADKLPEHRRVSTQDRIERKLGKKRVLLTLARAVYISREDYPYVDYIRALEALLKIDPCDPWRNSLNAARRTLAEYEARLGSLPPSECSIIAVNAQLQNIGADETQRLAVSNSKGLGALLAFNARRGGKRN